MFHDVIFIVLARTPRVRTQRLTMTKLINSCSLLADEGVAVGVFVLLLLSDLVSTVDKLELMDAWLSFVVCDGSCSAPSAELQALLPPGRGTGWLAPLSMTSPRVLLPPSPDSSAT